MRTSFLRNLRHLRMPPQMGAFARLHAAYSVLDPAKLVLCGVLAWRVVR